MDPRNIHNFMVILADLMGEFRRKIFDGNCYFWDFYMEMGRVLRNYIERVWRDGWRDWRREGNRGGVYYGIMEDWDLRNIGMERVFCEEIDIIYRKGVRKYFWRIKN